MPERRVSLYFSWSRPAEMGADLGVLENRFPTLFEFRRRIWPHYEHASDAALFRQDVSGFLDHVVLLDFTRFREVMGAVTGHEVRVTQRESEAALTGPAPLTAEYLAGCDTLIVVSLDHYRTGQLPTAAEIEAVREFLRRDKACLVVCPHHTVGVPKGLGAREVEFLHHGDGLVPAQQLLGGYGRGLLKGLGIPVDNRFGLNPALSASRDGPAPLEVFRDLDGLGVMGVSGNQEVSTFNLHPHLPHLEVDPEAAVPIHVLARQQINPASSPHPFVEAGNRYFNALLWAPPEGERAGNIFVCDATIWSAAFGGLESLTNFWSNLARI